MNIRKSDNRGAYTIIELLTVMTIIIILIGLLVPSLNMVKRFARKVRQKAQFHAIDVAMELYNNEFEGYPDSDEEDEDGKQYCGALRLCEAMMGQDLQGFHPDSHYRADCTDGTNQLYDNPPGIFPPPGIPEDNLRARRGPYLVLENANAYRLRNIYGNDTGDTDPFDPYLFVLCDVYTRVANQGTVGKPKIGMPILYYKANVAGTRHPYLDEEGKFVGNVDDSENFYDYKDNHNLVRLGMPWDNTGIHKLERDPGPPAEPEGQRFYINTNNRKIPSTRGVPYKSDSYILISAGFDGIYGTDDDVYNFDE